MSNDRFQFTQRLEQEHVDELDKLAFTPVASATRNKTIQNLIMQYRPLYEKYQELDKQYRKVVGMLADVKEAQSDVERSKQRLERALNSIK